MSAFSSDKDQRGAARHTLPRPVPATLGGYAGNLTEISLTGCQFEHVDRVTPKQRLPLRFTWRKTPVRIEALVVRSQMKLVKGKAAYTSGLEFCANANESPAVIRDIISWLDKEKAREIAAAEPPPPTPKTDDKEKVPFLRIEEEDDEPELLNMPYLQCVLSGGKWMKLYVDDPSQPKEGFTIAAPQNEAEADVLCRAYEKAGPDGRRSMRASFASALPRNGR